MRQELGLKFSMDKKYAFSPERRDAPTEGCGIVWKALKTDLFDACVSRTHPLSRSTMSGRHSSEPKIEKVQAGRQTVLRV